MQKHTSTWIHVADALPFCLIGGLAKSAYDGSAQTSITERQAHDKRRIDCGSSTAINTVFFERHHLRAPRGRIGFARANKAGDFDGESRSGVAARPNSDKSILTTRTVCWRDLIRFATDGSASILNPAKIALSYSVSISHHRLLFLRQFRPDGLPVVWEHVLTSHGAVRIDFNCDCKSGRNRSKPIGPVRHVRCVCPDCRSKPRGSATPLLFKVFF